MRSPTAYSIAGYAEMIRCEPRTSAYAEALRQAITPGCTVIDIGAGSGFFSLLACQYGAGSVIAVEPNDVIELLLGAAAANGFRNRITVHKCLSTEISNNVKADVLISDIRGCLPLFEGHISAISDARQRLLKPNGRLIPACDSLFAAIVNHSATSRNYEEPWLSNKFEIDLTTSHRYAVNEWRKVNLRAEDLLSEPELLGVLDYRTIREANFAANVNLVIDRPGLAQGLAVWFDCELFPGIGFSNAPGAPELIYGQAFFPLEHGIPVSSGDQIEIEIRADLIEGSYVWSWNTRVGNRRSSAPDITYRQSSFLAKVLSPGKLARRSNHYVPPALATHMVDRYCLSLFDGRRTLGEIANALAAEFPNLFNGGPSALNHVVELAERYPQARTDSDMFKSET